ncbi:hypothetical protein V8C44DRAFT_246734 [Trichoderma aethiopicum]
MQRNNFQRATCGPCLAIAEPEWQLSGHQLEAAAPPCSHGRGTLWPVPCTAPPKGNPGSDLIARTQIWQQACLQLAEFFGLLFFSQGASRRNCETTKYHLFSGSRRNQLIEEQKEEQIFEIERIRSKVKNEDELMPSIGVQVVLGTCHLAQAEPEAPRRSSLSFFPLLCDFCPPQQIFMSVRESMGHQPAKMCSSCRSASATCVCRRMCMYRVPCGTKFPSHSRWAGGETASHCPRGCCPDRPRLGVDLG